MATRLGNVLYWSACGIAGLLLFVTVLVTIYAGSDDRVVFGVMFGIGAVLVWLMGRAARYILSAR